MPVVTLTTDFGQRDYYLPLLKGALLDQDDQLRLVDITHQINSYDIVQAAFIFQNAWHSFPTGTIHLISVNDYYQAQCRYLAFQHADHAFVGPDNGLFTLIFPDIDMIAYQLPQSPEQPLREVYARAVGHVAQGNPWEQIGTPIEVLLQRITFQPVVQPATIRGSVIYIDRFDNAILNIRRPLFEQVGKGRPFQLYFKRHDPLTNLCRHYHDVPIGEILCRFNGAGYLQIAINMGRAAGLLGLKVEDMVQIDFQSIPETT